MNQADAFKRAFAQIGERKRWEDKQRAFSEMRHDGLRRINKPWPMAADFHFPLIDMAIGNLKPFWIAQAFSGERIADFISMQEQAQDMSEAAADFMDFDLRYMSDFRYRMEQAVDMMLLRGRGILKIIHDARRNKIKFRSIDPMNILMDGGFDDFEDADEFTEIQKLTLEQYKAEQNFNQSKDVIDAIKGRDNWEFPADADKDLREGVTHSTKTDRVVLWNHYQRRGSDWLLTTYAPVAVDKVIREPFSLTTTWDGEPLLPFYSITMEIKDEGWFSPRGIAELNAAFEVYCCKLWNEKADAMTYGNRPLFTGDKELDNTTNLRFMPGEYVPGNIQSVQMQPPAYSFAEEINFTRGVAEQRSKMPDYGVTSEGDSQTGGKPRTATENNRISALQDVGADHNGDVFRNVRLTKIYRHVWALEVQFKKEKLAYYAGDSIKQLPPETLHQAYLVIPAGGSGTKEQKLKRAMMRFQLFKGAPNIDQDELFRNVISADDSRLVKKLLLPQNQKQQQEYLDQVIKINAGLVDGFPVPPFPSEDQQIRIKACIDWLHKQAMTGAPPNPIAIHAVQMHIAARFQMLQQMNPKAAAQVKQMIMQAEQQSQQQQPGNVSQLPQPGGQQGPPQQQAMAE